MERQVFTGVLVMRHGQEEIPMLRWAFIFLVVGLIAGLLGFTGIAGASIGIAKFLFFLFLIAFVISLVTHMARRV